MKFKQFLEEAVISKFDKDELKTAKEIIKQIEKSKLQNKKVFYRGFSSLKQHFAELTNERNSFYGALDTGTSTFIREYLKIKNPTFITSEIYQAEMFGKVHIFIPEDSKFVYSMTIRDVLSDLSFDGTEEDYKSASNLYETTKKLSEVRSFGEVLVDTKKYFLLDYISLSKSFKSKFFEPKKSINDLTYKDVLDLMKSYVAVTEWKIKNGYRDDFETSTNKTNKAMDRMKSLRKDRRSDKQLGVRSKKIEGLLSNIEANYEKENFNFTFKTIKAAKEAWKVLKKEIDNPNNYRKSTNLSVIDFYDAKLEKKTIVTQ